LSVQKLKLPISGFFNGLNTEASVLNVLPSEFMDGSINVELLPNASLRRRRGISFLGEDANGAVVHTVLASTIVAETKQQSPSCLYVRLTSSNGNTFERVIVNIGNAFLIFEATKAALKDWDHPYQTLSRAEHSATAQKFEHLTMKQSGNKIFFAGKYTQPGYLFVADNETLAIHYYNVLIRDLNAGLVTPVVSAPPAPYLGTFALTGAIDPSTFSTLTGTGSVSSTKNARVSKNNRWYDCIETHVSDATNSPGDGTGYWQRYWMVLSGPIPTTPAIAAWASGTTYTSTFIKRYNADTPVVDGVTFPTTVEFFANRVWLAGDPKYPNTVYFSQSIVSDDDIYRFHQEADPLEPEDPDLVDDDGGLFEIQSGGRVFCLLAMTGQVYAGTDLGVHEIKGPTGVFKATDFSVVQVLTDGVLGPGNMVRTEREFLVFGRSSVWRSDLNNIFTSSTFTSFVSLSDNTIAGDYAAIPEGNKSRGVAVYNPSDLRVYYFVSKDLTAFDNLYARQAAPGYVRNCLVVGTRFSDKESKDLMDGGSSDASTRRTIKAPFFWYEFADTALTEVPYIAYPYLCKFLNTTSVNVVDSDVLVVDSAVQVVAEAPSSDVAFEVILLALIREVE
jgi:hypothetical protein